MQNNRLEGFDIGVLSYIRCLPRVTLRVTRIHTIENEAPSKVSGRIEMQSCSEHDGMSEDLRIVL